MSTPGGNQKMTIVSKAGLHLRNGWLILQGGELQEVEDARKLLGFNVWGVLLKFKQNL